ncbi:MAG: hypothetical protein A2V93_00930 [Ignavibacteria bacterium RBG_16_34_14]|nr:MAG: hypothetical protein A2V93_00930 [Ignavibacteria bacterium RBG_16_34_14]
MTTSARASRVLNCRGEKYFNPYLALSADDNKIKVRTAFRTSKINEIIITTLRDKEVFHNTITAVVSVHKSKYAPITAEKTNCQANSFTKSINLRKSETAYQHINIFINDRAEKFIMNKELKLVKDGTIRLTRQKAKKRKLNMSNTFK